MELTPLEVIIGLKTDGSAKYPDFNSLPIVRDSGLDWSVYIDNQGSGWLYDCCGHKESDPNSPVGSQLGMILVPAVFATQAVETFPSTVSKLTEIEAENFYDNKHAKEFADEEISQTIVDAIRTKQDLELALTVNQIDAIDPTTDTPGIRANWRKTFDTFKTKRGITIAK